MLANLSERGKNNLRAISLSLLLPIWNIFTNRMPTHIDFLKWLAISFTLYCLWQALYLSSKKENKRKWLEILASYVLVTSMAYILFVVLILHDTEKFRWLFLFKFLMVAILFRIIQFGIRASEDRTQLQMEKQQMLAENYRVQLQELRSKVDPHFLFNSLNTLRVMVRNGNKDSEKFVMSLCDFYRQTLKYNESSVITIAEEMNVLNSYFFLMQTRNKDAVSINIELPENVIKNKVPTLSMQILIENCFKHNRMSATQPLQIEIYSDENYICIKNNIQPKISHFEPSGYGLSNIRSRYELLNILDNSIVINKNEDYFEVKLKMIQG
ncbi:MAG: histidine kinase [Bacteroidales bacterium]|nr:histidine kinase [Bacteroidales bacterium]